MKVNIGSVQYDLKMKDKIFEDGQRFRGTLEECKWLIEISKEFPKQAREQTFWHEVVHGILYEIGEQELNADEGFVDAFAKQLYMFNKNNNINKIYEKLRD